jgi:general secretion pathway protein G
MTGRRLAIILGVIMILGAVYGTHIIRREKIRHFQRAVALQDNLASMRKAIDSFHAAEGRYPRTLDELVPKYIRRIPPDPVTGSASTWRVTTEETVQPSSDFLTATAPKTEKYIVDVHSGASGKDANGIRFADY